MGIIYLLAGVVFIFCAIQSIIFKVTGAAIFFAFLTVLTFVSYKGVRSQDP